MKNVNFIISQNNITVNFDGQTHMLSKQDAYAEQLIQALREKNWDSIPDLISLAKKIESSSNGFFSVKEGEIFIDGKVVPSILGKKIEEFYNEKLPFEPLVAFAKKLQNNPSFRATQNLYQFLEKNNHPITQNGNFIAYKKVKNNFLDIHSQSIDNSPGKIISMERNMVDEDPNNTCSNGLHVANWYYAHHCYGDNSTDIMLEVEVNPEDVVAIPVDYDQSKMRVCKYVVIGVVSEESSFPLKIVSPISDSYQPYHSNDIEEIDDDGEYCEECDCDEYCEKCDGINNNCYDL